MSDFKKNQLPTPGKRFIQKIYRFVNAKNEEEKESLSKAIFDMIEDLFTGLNEEEIRDTFSSLIKDDPIIFHAKSEIATAVNAECGTEFSAEDIKKAEVTEINGNTNPLLPKVYTILKGNTFYLIYDHGKESKLQIIFKDVR